MVDGSALAIEDVVAVAHGQARAILAERRSFLRKV